MITRPAGFRCDLDDLLLSFLLSLYDRFAAWASITAAPLRIHFGSIIAACRIDLEWPGRVEFCQSGSGPGCAEIRHSAEGRVWPIPEQPLWSAQRQEADVRAWGLPTAPLTRSHD